MSDATDNRFYREGYQTMSNEPTKLRALAEAIDRLDALKSFDYQIRPDEITCSWITGAAVGGYHEMAAAIGHIVGQRYETLRLEAIAKAEEEVARRRGEWAEADAT